MALTPNTYTRGVVLDFSRPGKPTDNAFIEAFNGRFRVQMFLPNRGPSCGAGRVPGEPPKDANSLSSGILRQSAAL